MSYEISAIQRARIPASNSDSSNACRHLLDIIKLPSGKTPARLDNI